MTRGSNARFRREVFEANKKQDDRGIYLVCGICHCRIDPVRDRWDADHHHALGSGGSNSADNGRPLCVHCHGTKTATEDIPKVAKSKRVSAKHFDVKTKAGFRKPPPGFKFDWSQGRLVKMGEDDD